MRGIVPAARARAEREQADIQNVIDDEQGGFSVQAWDWAYYAERVRLEKYALDESQIKPYLALNRALEEGVFWAASQLLASVLSSALIFPFIIRTFACGK